MFFWQNRMVHLHSLNLILETLSFILAYQLKNQHLGTYSCLTQGSGR